jgi:transcriptional regulator with XRE-family HTH domain
LGQCGFAACLGTQVIDELGACLVERLAEPEQRAGVVDDEPQRVPTEAVLTEDDLHEVVRGVHVRPHRAAAVEVGVLVCAQVVHATDVALLPSLPSRNANALCNILTCGFILYGVDMAANGPTPRALRLGSALREARDAIGMGQRELAALVGIHHTILSKIENGHRVPSTEQTATILAHLHVNGDRADAIIELARATSAPLWLAVTLPEQHHQMEALLDFERNARTVTEVSPLLIPGLLQTTNYIRAIMSIAVSPKEVETRTAVRIGRRESIIREERPVKFEALIGEGALHQIIGDTRIMIEQLNHLLKMAGRPNIDLRVVPFGSGWHPGLEGAFGLIEPEEGEPIVHLENRRSGLFLHMPADIKLYQEAVEWERRIAMSPEVSAALITALINKMESQ